MTVNITLGGILAVIDLVLRALAAWQMLSAFYHFGRGRTEDATFRMASAAAIFALLASSQ